VWFHRSVRFEAEKKELLQKKLKLSKENDEKKSKLDELEKQLDRFVVVSFPSISLAPFFVVVVCNPLSQIRSIG
jgi:hypothetical protein